MYDRCCSRGNTLNIQAYPLVTLALDRICEVYPFTMSFPLHSEPVKKSICKVGLINPPIVRKKAIEKEFETISGARRITALRALGYTEVACRLVPEDGISDLEVVLLNLFDNITTREFNPVEKGMALALLTSQMTREEVLVSYMPVLGLPKHEPSLDLHMMIAKELSGDIKIAIALGRMPLQVASELIYLPQCDQESVFKTIDYLMLNNNYQIQFIDLLKDMSFIAGSSITEFLLRANLTEIINDKNLSNPRKARKLMDHLRNLRNPTLAMAEKAFKESLASIALPEGDTIIAPQYFESPYYELRVRFKDREELNKKLDSIASLEGINRLLEPWKSGE